ncbi:unnamed protein product [Urochloa humidicola]
MLSFLTFSLDKLNEDLTIIITEPKISKDDFWPFARELRRFLLDNQVVAGPVDVGPGAKRPLMDAEVNSDDDVRIIIPKDEATPSTKRPKKRRARKPRAPPRKEFIRRSERLNTDLHGFHTRESKEKHVARKELVVTGHDQKESRGRTGSRG